jgi:hypothetical protein
LGPFEKGVKCSALIYTEGVGAGTC